MKNDILNDISALSNLKDITDDGFIMVEENPELSEVCIFSSLSNTKGGKKASMFNNKEDFEEKLLNLIENYLTFSKKLESYPFNASKMSLDYLNLFEKMYKNKEVYFKTRDIEYKKSFIGKKIFNYKRKKINY